MVRFVFSIFLRRKIFVVSVDIQEQLHLLVISIENIVVKNKRKNSKKNSLAMSKRTSKKADNAFSHIIFYLQLSLASVCGTTVASIYGLNCVVK
jgi:hypothetical protein